MENIFITIMAESKLGLKPLKIGRVVKLTKEHGHDGDTVRVSLPFIDTVGYVADKAGKVYKGTYSASRLYDKIGDEVFAQIMFVTNESAIALVLQQCGEEDDGSESFELEAEPHNMTSGTKTDKPNEKKIGFC